MHSAVYVMTPCLSVHLSVTQRYCIEKDRARFFGTEATVGVSCTLFYNGIEYLQDKNTSFLNLVLNSDLSQGNTIAINLGRGSMSK